MLRVVQDRVCCRDSLSCRRSFFTSIHIAIETWEVAAANLEAKPMSLLENIAGGPHINRELVCLTRIHQSRLLLRVAISGPHDAFRQILSKAIWPHIN